MSLFKSATIGAFCTLIGFAASAADYGSPMFAPPPLDPPQAVELGSGWYLRGDTSWGRASLPQLNSDATFSKAPKSTESWTLGLGAGYKFNNWFRTDLTVDYRNAQASRTVGSNVWCPYNLQGLTTSGGTIQLGYAYNDNDTCSPVARAYVRRLQPMLNGYIDLGTWSGFTPYVGAGVGFSYTNTRQQLNYSKTSDGTSYAADLTPTGTYPLIWVSRFDGSTITPQPKVAFTKQNWDTYYKSTAWNFSWALMAGVGIDVAPHTKIDVGYRYENFGSFKSVNANTGQTSTQQITAQEVRLGLRYSPD